MKVRVYNTGDGSELGVIVADDGARARWEFTAPNRGRWALSTQGTIVKGSFIHNGKELKVTPATGRLTEPRAQALFERWGPAKKAALEQAEKMGVELGVRRGNPPSRPHRVPAITAHLGRALDVVIERNDGEREKWDEIRGFQLLAPADAMDRSPGAGRLYVVAGKLEDREPVELGDHADAEHTYQQWHRRPADVTGRIEVPDAIGVPLGRAIRIGYKSDKFGRKGAEVAYEHDFSEPYPRVYVTSRKAPRAMVLSGGNFTVSGRGIED